MNGPRFRRFGNRSELVLWGPALATAAVILYRFDPSLLHGWPCPFHWATGLACPGCGTLRAAHCLLHGHVAAACGFNVLMVLSLPFLVALIWEQASRAPAASLRLIVRRMAPSIPAIVIAYWILRNLPFYPFTLLSP